MGVAGLAMVTLFILLFIINIWRVVWIVLWRPFLLTKYFEKQGVKGPPYKLLYGSLAEMKMLKKASRLNILDTNSNDITHRVVPHYHLWFSEYGKTTLYWNGTQPIITITEPELAKQILSNKFGFFVKPKVRPSIRILIGKGLNLMEGAEWVRHRRVLNPAFSMDKLKIMIKKMADSTISMLDEWNRKCDDQSAVRIEMSQKFQELTVDIIAHTAFGSNFVEGKQVFEAQKELQKCCAASNTDIFIPGTQYLPTPINLQIWKLDKQLKAAVKVIIESRLEKAKSSLNGDYGDDLLGLMIESSLSKTAEDQTLCLSMDEIIENCKLFFFAGQETTANLLTWTCFLLSIHKEWQEKLREEVIKECGVMEIPDADMLAKLKLVNMVLLEVLRLYCPVINVVREASRDMKLGNLRVLKGTCVSISIVQIHRSKEYWGEDANEFNPWRFVNGVSKAAKHPNALLGFSTGPRFCIGQNFAMLEAKIALVLIIQRFALSLSKEYKHAPVDSITLHPQFGLPIDVKSLHM